MDRLVGGGGMVVIVIACPGGEFFPVRRGLVSRGLINVAFFLSFLSVPAFRGILAEQPEHGRQHKKSARSIMRLKMESSFIYINVSQMATMKPHFFP